MHTGPGALSSAAHSTPDWKRCGRYQPISQLPQFPVAADFVEKAEAFLKALVQEPKQRAKPPQFPLPSLSSSLPVAQEMMQELKHSWDCYHQHPKPIKLKSTTALSKGPYSLVSTS